MRFKAATPLDFSWTGYQMGSIENRGHASVSLDINLRCACSLEVQLCPAPFQPVH